MLELIIGPMSAGKTEELSRRLRCASIAIGSDKVLAFKYNLDDDRYGSGLRSHFRQDYILYESTSTDCLLSIIPDIISRGIKVVGIDEFQFYSDVCEFVEKTLSLGIRVIMSGLDSTYERLPFNDCLNRLLIHATKIDKLLGICRVCKRENAIYTKRLTDSKDIIMIGGIDCYECRCYDCFDL